MRPGIFDDLLLVKCILNIYDFVFYMYRTVFGSKKAKTKNINQVIIYSLLMFKNFKSIQSNGPKQDIKK